MQYYYNNQKEKEKNNKKTDWHLFDGFSFLMEAIENNEHQNETDRKCNV